MTSIKRSLADAATKHAQRAVQAFLHDEFGDFYLSAGIALENAMKSRLARENVLFIAPDRHFRSWTALAQFEKDVEALPAGTRTVGGVEAFTRVLELEPALKQRRELVAQILAYRNGEAHLGSAGSTEHRSAFTGFLLVVGELLKVPPEDFWGEHAELVRTAVDETVADTERKVVELLARATATYSSRYGALEETQRSTLLKQIEIRARRHEAPELSVVRCPACGNDAGLLTGETRLEFDTEFGRDGDVEREPYLEFHGHFLECECCDLELDGDDELSAAKVDNVFQNETDDLDEFLRDYYGQEDTFMGPS